MNSYSILVLGLVTFMVMTSAMGMSLGNGNAEQQDVEGAGDSNEDADWLRYMRDNRLAKRFAASDPRSLFKAVYSNYG
jgi:hypothetical protein